MAEHHRWVQHIESYVGSSCSPTQQTASLDAIATLVKNDVLTVEALVRELEMYLTTTDYIIRSKGILLLAEVLSRLASKLLDSAILHSLTGFFTERLEDWKALHGALVGCLALMRRNIKFGMVTTSDATVVARTFLQNQQVQALGQHDRMLCFELLECLMDRYPDAILVLGDNLVYGICEAIDGEKDPQCLTHTFHLVELLARLFPGSSGPVANFAGEIFEILGGYFPIHFTHPGGEDGDAKRNDLSKALMVAFSCTPLFEPYAIPLLFEKLSSSLLVAKVDSLKYLRSCTLKYGGSIMEKYAKSLWSSIKDAVYTSTHEPNVSYTFSDMDGALSFPVDEITTEALLLLQEVVMQNPDLFVKLITNDEDIHMFINSIASYRSFSDIPSGSSRKVYAIGQILSVSVKASISSCTGLLGHFFPHLINIMGLPVKSALKDCIADEDLSERVNVGVLFLCIELLSACRDLSLDSVLIAESFSQLETSRLMLHSFLDSLTVAVSSTLVTNANAGIHDLDCYIGVKGLQTLATFPEIFLPLSKALYDNILLKLMSIITMDSKKTLKWKLVLKALVQIGNFIENHDEAEKAPSYMCIVVEGIVSLISLDDSSLPFSLRVEALCDVGTSGLKFTQRVVQGIEDAITANLSEGHGNSMRVKITIQLLECYSSKILPWLKKIEFHEEIPLNFAHRVWDQIGNMILSASVREKELLIALMTTMKASVGGCSKEAQGIVVRKAYDVLSSCNSCFNDPMTIKVPASLRKLQSAQCLDDIPIQDEWLLSLFSSVIIALRPQTYIQDLSGILNLFTSAFLMGHVPAAEALGSIINKLPSTVNGAEVQCDLSLEEALDMIFDRSLWNFNDENPFRKYSVGGEDNEISLFNLHSSSAKSKALQVHAIVGLAWIGKGLLMRGHGKVKEVTKILFRCLLLDGDEGALPLRQGSVDNSNIEDLVSSVKLAAADAFHILMSDSDTCLNRKFHAIIRPLYKQRIFSSLMPVLLSLISKSDVSTTRLALYQACLYVISDTPLTAILGEANKIIPILVDGLSMLTEEITKKDLIYNLLLVLSGILTDKNGQEVVKENAQIIIKCLTKLVSYPHMMLVRETAIQCLTAMSCLPYARTYPMRTQVLLSIAKAFDDPKRAVRLEAVRCQRSWTSISSRGS